MNLKNYFTYIVRTGSVLCFSASAVVISCSLLFGMPIDFNLPLIVFLLTFSSYYINRKTEIEQDRISHPERTKFIEKNRNLDILAFLAIIIALFLAYQKNFESFLLTLIPPISVLLYSVSIHQKIKRFKDVPWLKTTFVALVWTVYVFLTATYNSIPISPAVIVMAIFVFSRIFIDCVIFDIRDIIADRLYNVRTLPIIFGEKKTIDLMIISNALTGVFIFIAVQLGWLPFFAHALNIITIYGHFYIKLSNNPKISKHFLCDVIVDGEYILWPFVLLLGNALLQLL